MSEAACQKQQRKRWRHNKAVPTTKGGQAPKSKKPKLCLLNLKLSSNHVVLGLPEKDMFAASVSDCMADTTNVAVGLQSCQIHCEILMTQ